VKIKDTINTVVAISIFLPVIGVCAILAVGHDLLFPPARECKKRDYHKVYKNHKGKRKCFTCGKTVKEK